MRIHLKIVISTILYKDLIMIFMISTLPKILNQKNFEFINFIFIWLNVFLYFYTFYFKGEVLRNSFVTEEKI